MAENTKIEWAHHTFNPWEGCQKVGPGCDHCYAEARNARFGGGTAPNWGPGAPRRRTSTSNWQQPIKWDREAGRAAHADTDGSHERPRVFCSSLADVFDNAVDWKWRNDLFALIDATPHLDWLLLTKRIGNARDMLPFMWTQAGKMPANVWIGATIVNQAEAERDIPKLLATPAAKRFLSMEPLLGPVDLTMIDLGPSEAREREASGLVLLNALTGVHFDAEDAIPGIYGSPDPRIDWVIVGGESGTGARPMHPDWARSLRDQCAEADVPFLFKQWGEYSDFDHIGMLWNDLPDGVRRNQQFVDGKAMIRVGKKLAGRLLDGVQHDGVPA